MSITDFLTSLGPQDGPDTGQTPDWPVPELGSVGQSDKVSGLLSGLRDRGMSLARIGTRLFVINAQHLTDDDRTALQNTKTELLAILPEWQSPQSAPLQTEPQSPPFASTSSIQVTTSGSTLAHFLGTAPVVEPTWHAQEPPSLDGIDHIILNFETTGVDWAKGDRPIGVTIGTPDGLLKRYLPFAHRGGGNLDEATVIRYLQREVRNKHIDNINTRFDVHMGRNIDVDFEAQGCTVSDIQHYAALLDDHRKKFALDVLAKDYLGGIEVPRVDERYMASYAPHEVAPRAEYQVQLIAELRNVLWPLLDKEDLQRVRQLEDDVIYPVVEMERNAAPIDMPLLEKWCAETEQIHSDLLLKVSQAVGFSVNPDSSADWQRLFAHLGLPHTEVTDSACRDCRTTWNDISITACPQCRSSNVRNGQPSFTDKVLKATDHPHVQMARKAGKLASLRSKFLVAYREVIGDDHLLRYALHQLRVDEHGTVRGRFSASDKNIQQVMNRDTHMESFGSEDFFIRRLFIPASGLYFAADAAQIEFRLFAHFSESRRLLDRYAADPTVSFHRIAEAMIKPFKSDIPYTKIKSMNFLCVTEDTPILTHDLRWVPASSLRAGDQLLAFDENQREIAGRAGARRWRIANIIGSTTQLAECYEITLENGDVLRATGDHLWITKGWHEKNRWRRTDQLNTDLSNRLMKVVDVWSEDNTKEAGWLAGFFDGEGNASVSGSQLTVHQNYGDLLLYCASLLDAKGYSTNAPDNFKSTSSCVQISLTGVVSDRLKFLGEIRPRRLLKNFVAHLDGRMFQAKTHVRITGVKPIGLQRVAVIETDVRTYIANGYASHNCIYGGGKGHLAEYLDLSQKISDQFYEIYHKAFPEVRSLSRQVGDAAKANGFVTSLLGRRARFPDSKFAYKALNAVIQPSAADIFKQKVVEVHRERKQTGFVMRMPVHDELCGDVPDAEGARMVSEILNRQSFPLKVPILWEGKTGANWAECK